MHKKRILIGDNLEMDLASLIRSRLLIQANSGGGKSWLLRRVLEQSHGSVQHLVIDPEGEYASLRERFDYVLAAKDGDTPVDPRNARVLAERLLELKASAILDLYELRHDDRTLFVREFLDALVNAPKALWHPVLVVIDEAHVFCPQQNRDESASAGSVIDLCTRGRKRGYCAVLATQRLSKLHKDAAAECNNKLFGRTSLDTDIKRVSDELGFSTREQKQELRTLKPGEFFAYGPALTKTIEIVHVAEIKTTHPKAGMRFREHVPAPTKRIRSLLPKLGDIPAEVETRELTVRELKSRAVAAERRTQELERVLAAGKPPALLTPADRAALERFSIELGGVASALNERTQRAISDTVDRVGASVTAAIAAAAERMTGAHEKARQQLAAMLRRKRMQAVVKAIEKQAPIDASKPIAAALATRLMPNATQKYLDRAAAARVELSDEQKKLATIDRAEGRILAAVFQFPNDKVRRIAALARVNSKRSTFRVAIKRLRQAGLLSGDAHAGFRVTPSGIAAASTLPLLKTGSDALADVRAALPEGAARSIFDAVMSSEPHGAIVPADYIAQKTALDPNVSTFRVACGLLKTRGIIEGSKRTGYKLSEEYV